MPVVEHIDRHGKQYLDLDSLLLTQNRMIFVNETITDDLAISVAKQLFYLSSVGTQDITLVINSPGGSVTAGLAIFDAIHGVPGDVATVCLGQASSMGAFLLAAGTKGKRSVLPNSEVMIHQVMGGVQGQAIDVQIAANRIARMKDTVNELLAAFTGQSLERIRTDTERDFFMNAEEAVAYGMADSIKHTLF